MNNDVVQELVGHLFPNREMNLLERKFNFNTLTVKLEDMEDGLVGIYIIQCQFTGFAKSLTQGNFEVEKD